MQLVPTATLITGVGIEGDKHAVATSDRQGLLADQETLDEVCVEPGTIKENLTVEGLPVIGLPTAPRGRVGNTAGLEIQKVRQTRFRLGEDLIGRQERPLGPRAMEW